MGYEFEMARQAAQAELDEIGDMLARRQEIAAPMPEWTPPASEPVQQRRTRAVEPRQVQPQQPLIDWEKTALWVQQHIDQRVGAKTREYVHDVVVAIAQEAGTICGELKARLDAADAKIAALEAEIEGLRQRAAPKPPELRTVGFSDAAD